MFNQALQEQIAVEGQSIPLDSDSKMSIQMTMNHLVVSVIKKIAGRYTPAWWDCICKMGSMPIGLILNYVARHVYCVEVTHSFVPIVKSEFIVKIAKKCTTFHMLTSLSKDH
jgi:hypothetical protein